MVTGTLPLLCYLSILELQQTVLPFLLLFVLAHSTATANSTVHWQWKDGTMSSRVSHWNDCRMSTSYRIGTKTDCITSSKTMCSRTQRPFYSILLNRVQEQARMPHHSFADSRENGIVM